MIGELNCMNYDKMIKLPHYKGCFACGKDNEMGLKMCFFYNRNDESIHSAFTPKDYHIGFNGIIHGGIVTTILDESMAWSAILKSGKPCLTLNMSTKFLLPMKPQMEYLIKSHCISQDEIYYNAEAIIYDSKDREFAKAEASFKKLTGRRAEIFKNEINLKGITNGI